VESSSGKDADLQVLRNSYWYAAPRSLVGFRNQVDTGPEPISCQAVWWVERVEQRFLLGYSWALHSDAEQVKVRRLAVSVAPDNTVHIWSYGGGSGGNNASDGFTGTGAWDGKKFTVHVADGDLVQWAHMVRAVSLERTLPGCTVSIDQLANQLCPVPEALSQPSKSPSCGCPAFTEPLGLCCGRSPPAVVHAFVVAPAPAG